MNGYVKYLIEVYRETNEFYNRFLLGETTMVVYFDMKDTRYFEDGINKIMVTLDISNKFKYSIIDTRLFVDCKFFINEVIAIADCSKLEIYEIEINSNREGVTEIRLDTSYEVIKIDLDSYTGLHIDFCDTCYTYIRDLGSIDRFLTLIKDLDSGSVSLNYKFNKNMEIGLEKLLNSSLLEKLVLEVQPLHLLEDEPSYYVAYKNLYDKLNGLGFFNQKNTLKLPEKDFLNMIRDGDIGSVTTEGLELISNMKSGVYELKIMS